MQTDYAKSAYEMLIAESTRIGELYEDLAKEACKPVESFMSKLPKIA
jgi:hypothetical protein